jgi:hypothetical protein
MVKSKSPAAILTEAIGGNWSVDREYVESIRQNLKPLIKRFGTAKMGNSIYPDPKRLETMTGTRWTIQFQGGPSISTVISNSGQVIERTYMDQGNLHFDDVVKIMRGWQKAIEQAQHGGRPTGMSEATQERYRKIYADYRMYTGTEDQFCAKAQIKRRTLDRAIAYCATLKDVTPKRP